MTLSLSKPNEGSVGWAAAINQNWTDIENAVNAGASAPAGSITMYGATTAPSGWLLCDGASVLRGDYPALFAVIGTTFGSVDGTHFNVPDLRSRSPLGTGQGSGLSNRALAATVGEENHQLTVNEMPSHRHGFDSWAGTTGSSYPLQSNGVNNNGLNTYYTGGDAAHNTMHPCLVVTFIIKT